MKRTEFVVMACALVLAVGCAADRPASDIDDSRTAEPGALEAPDATATSGELEQAHGASGDARHFAQQAAMAGLTEVTLGRLAQERAQAPEVKAFAEMMVRDHSKSGAELTQAVSRYNVDLPTTLDGEHRELFDRLNALQGAEFDREYMKAMVDGHEKVESLVESRAAHGSIPPAATGTSGESDADSRLDAAVDQWVASTLPRVREHLDRAEAISATLK